MIAEFTPIQKETLYEVLESRRDVRSGFSTEPVSEELLNKILMAAHHAPSVGFMQPWNFILIRSTEKKELVKNAFLAARQQESGVFTEERKELYDSLKLEGILEAPLNILVTCERNRGGESGLGREVQTEMDLYSTVCAVQNLWLAARVEGVGVGWVSIIEKPALRDIFKLPGTVEPVAYLCVGYVKEFSQKPDLETAGWEERLQLSKLIFEEEWPQS